MRKTFKWILLVCFFVTLTITFSALSCSVTPTGFILSVFNTQGAGITVEVWINGAKEITLADGYYGLITVDSGDEVWVYDVTHTSWLAIGYGGAWYSYHTVTQSVTMSVKYNIFDLYHVELSY
jgi:hypothetical protein